MKRLLKRCTAGFLSLALLSSVPTFANEKFSILEIQENDGSEFLKIEENDDYLSFLMRSTEVQVNEEKTEIRFKNANEEDTSTYIINSETIYGRYEREIDKRSLDINAFVTGEMSGISLLIPAGRFYKYSKKENDVIPVVAVRHFFSEAVGVGNSNVDSAEKEFGMLKTLKIMQGDENGKLNVENPVTRAEMAQIVVNMIRLRNFAPSVSENEAFTDVSQDHWGYNAIYTAMLSGHVNGYGDGTFRPEDNVTYAQALKLLVSILGYTPLAEEKGGYPEGYLKVASEIGITKDVIFQDTDLALRKDIARFVMNAMYLPIMEQTVFMKDAPKYAVRDGQDGNPLVTFYDKYFYR